jgi:drug/metabolite transporter (DMT)-like permease
MKKSYLILHIAVVLAGFTGIFGKLITLNEGLLVWYRIFFSFIWLFFILKLFRVKTNIPVRNKLAIAKVGMLIMLHWVFFYGSIKYSNISIGVVCFCLASFFTAILEPIINRKRFVVTELLLSMLTLVGIALIFHFDATYQLGIIIGVISSLFGSLFTIYNERLVKHYDSRLINYYQMLSGMIGLGLIMPLYLYYFPVKQLVPALTDVLYLLVLSLFCTVGLYVMYAESLKRISAFTVSLTLNLEPIYSIIMAFLFFDEGKEVNTSFYVGLFFVAASVVLQTIISVRSRSKRTLAFE